ncbi:MAG TPA: hypothetical protein VL359_08875, partial [bacterium]|nr:hypothetical protein [bacterium]
AWQMDLSERQERMRRLKKAVRDHTIFDWVDSFLLAGSSVELGDFPVKSEGGPADGIDPWWEGA